MNDRCICCGAVIPEGSWTCPNCNVVSAPEWMAKRLGEVEVQETAKKKTKKKARTKAKPVVKVVLDEGAIMPTQAHKLDAGYDLYSREDAVIYQNTSGTFDTGVHIEIPPNHCGLLVSKSGLNIKHNCQSEGLIDSGYTGSICVKLYNHGAKAVEIKKGQKISQLVILPIITPDLKLVDSLEDTERGNGGFGSTGKF